MSFTNQLSNYGSYKYVVSATQPGPYATIQAAINQVVADSTTADIFVQPGTYTENLTLHTNINIVGSTDGIINIIGIHTPPAAGAFSIKNCRLSSATYIFDSAVAGTAALNVSACVFNITNGSVYHLTNWTGGLTIDNCTDISASNTVVFNAGAAGVTITESAIGATAAAAYLTVSGPTRIANSSIYCGVAATDQSAVLIDNSVIDSGVVLVAAFTISGTATAEIYNSRITAGALPCISHTSTQLVTLENDILDSSAAPAVIIGTGAIELGEIVFNSAHGIAGTITYANASQLSCSNLNIESKLFLNGSQGTAGQVLTSNGTSAPVWNNSVSTFWTVSTTDAVAMAVDTGYIPKNTLAHLTTYLLPLVSAIGTEIEISGFDSHLWTIAQNAGQSINFGNQTTTPGVGGSLSATNRYDQIRLVCVTANTVWNVVSSVGNITVV